MLAGSIVALSLGCELTLFYVVQFSEVFLNRNCGSIADLANPVLSQKVFVIFHLILD